MKKQKWIFSLFAVVLLVGTAGFSINAPRIQKAPLGEAPLHAPRAAVVYSSFFYLVVDLEKKASELESEGAKGDSLRSYVQTQANLNDDEARKLKAVAAACVEQIARQDAKALEVIQRLQSQFPGGRIPKGVKLPPPPPELRILQLERDQIILAAKNELDSVLGVAGSEKIEQFARSLTSIRPTPDAK